ncbi:MAG: hypothetical protein GX913_05090 [Clostridiales bacterium]|nr:hypothetical protein [Clostridiales bacterium]
MVAKGNVKAICGKREYSHIIDNVLDKMPERLEQQEDKLQMTKEQLANAKEELKKPFEQESELQDKVFRLAELNKLLDMGEVEELENHSPLIGLFYCI